MNKNYRQQSILDKIQSGNSASISDLANEFGVSEITIRRDLKYFLKQGLIEKTLGGMVVLQKKEDLPVLNRINEEKECKDGIAKAAADLIGESTTIFVGSGSTTASMIPYIIDRENFTVVTNALNIGFELARGKGLSIIVIGGYLRSTELSLVGHISDQALGELRVDKVFMGIKAIDIDSGLTNDYLPEVITDRKILDMNTETIILADHTKFGKTSSAFVAPINKVSILVTDEKTDPEMLKGIKEQGVKIIVANL